MAGPIDIDEVIFLEYFVRDGIFAIRMTLF